MINPFSSLYFIKENKKRCVPLIFMIVLSYAAYLGGLYATNPQDNFQYGVELLKNHATVCMTYSDKEGKDFNAVITDADKNEKLKLLPLGVSNCLYFNSIMGFEMDPRQYTFSSAEDFSYFCKKENIEGNFSDLKAKEFVMSRQFANNLGLNIGDTIDAEYEMASFINGTFTLAKIIDVNGYAAFYIDENEYQNYYMIVNDEMSENDFIAYTNHLNEKYDISLQNYELFKQRLNSQFSTMNVIYFAIVFILAFVLAITINAAFVGVYQRRTFEFAVYRGIGFSKRAICKKIILEILFIDAMGLFIGGVIFFIALYLCNNLWLYPIGKYFCYYHPVALLGLLLCNVIVVVPLIYFQTKRLIKADICEF